MLLKATERRHLSSGTKGLVPAQTPRAGSGVSSDTSLVIGRNLEERNIIRALQGILVSSEELKKAWEKTPDKALTQGKLDSEKSAGWCGPSTRQAYNDLLALKKITHPENSFPTLAKIKELRVALNLDKAKQSLPIAEPDVYQQGVRTRKLNTAVVVDSLERLPPATKFAALVHSLNEGWKTVITARARIPTQLDSKDITYEGVRWWFKKVTTDWRPSPSLKDVPDSYPTIFLGQDKSLIGVNRQNREQLSKRAGDLFYCPINPEVTSFNLSASAKYSRAV